MGSQWRFRVTTRRFAAKLLFQYRVVVKGRSNRRRTCEERLIVVHAQTAEAAYRSALKSGRSAQHRYRNPDGNPVHCEFIGILELLELGMECGPEEVWYDIKSMLMPKERSHKILPPKHELSAIYWAISDNRRKGR